MKDAQLREAYRAYTVGDLEENDFIRVIQRSGYQPVYEYELCTSCGVSRCNKSFGRIALCGDCGGSGWTHLTIVGWEEGIAPRLRSKYE